MNKFIPPLWSKLAANKRSQTELLPFYAERQFQCERTIFWYSKYAGTLSRVLEQLVVTVLHIYSWVHSSPSCWFGRTDLLDVSAHHRIVTPMSVEKYITASKPSPDDEVKRLGAFGYLLCGGIAGSSSRLITSPIDVLKLHYQTHGGALTKGTYYQTVGPLCREKLKRGGILSFWGGCGTSMARLFPYSGIKFYCFEHSKIWLTDNNGVRFTSEGNNLNGESIIYLSAVGAISGIIAMAITYPLDVVRTRKAIEVLHIEASEAARCEKTGTSPPKKLQHHRYQYRSISSSLGVVYRTEGYRGFYRGLLPSLLGVIPCEGVRFMAFEMFKDVLKFKMGIQVLLPFHHFCAGLAAGICSIWVSYPFDVVRKRMMVDHINDNYNYKNSFTRAIKGIWAEGGRKGLWRGIHFNRIKTPIFSAVSFTVYEQVRQRLVWILEQIYLFNYIHTGSTVRNGYG